MSIEDLTTIDQVTAFLEGTQRVIFEVPKDKDLRYQWVQRTLLKFHYLSLSRPDKGVLIRYLIRLSGYSRQQLTRLIKQYRDNEAADQFQKARRQLFKLIHERDRKRA